MSTSKTVLITGANRGIGLAFAEHYINDGWNVIVTARDPQRAEKLKALRPFKLLDLDTTDEASVKRAAEEVLGTPIHLLINNAGMLLEHGLLQATKDDFMRQFEVNAVGPFLVTRAFLPNLQLATKDTDCVKVVHISSQLGSIQATVSSSGYYGYRASKAALNMLHKNLAVDLRDQGILSLAIHPGYVQTEMTRGLGTVSPQSSVDGMTQVITQVGMELSGKFFDYQGHELPW